MLDFVRLFVRGQEVPDLPQIVALCNVLIHAYATVDDALVWQILTGRLPKLVEVLRNVQPR